MRAEHAVDLSRIEVLCLQSSLQCLYASTVDGDVRRKTRSPGGLKTAVGMPSGYSISGSSIARSHLLPSTAWFETPFFAECASIVVPSPCEIATWPMPFGGGFLIKTAPATAFA